MTRTLGRILGSAAIILELFNLLNETASDIDYVYTSRLREEPSTGIADIHTHPALPRSARATTQVSF